MVSGLGVIKIRNAEAINALERVLLGCDSPGVKMAAAFAHEVLTKRGVGGRQVPSRWKTNIEFAVSVTLLSAEMDHVLLKRKKFGGSLLGAVLDESSGSMLDVAQKIARHTSKDQSTEIALSGRALSVEIWDDDPELLVIGFNYLAISRETVAQRLDGDWQLVEFSDLDLNRHDPRESLALSEMLTTMGISNPYEMGDDRNEPSANTAA